MPRLLWSVLLAMIPGLSLGQKQLYEPFRAIQAGQPMEFFSRSLQANSDQTASLTFIAEPFGNGIPDGSALEWIDVDADGDIDFLSFTMSTGEVHLFENVNQSFVNVATSGLNMLVKAYYVTDANQDNRIDIVYVENRSIKVAVNNGDKTFTVQDAGVVLDWDGAPPLYCMDMDGDSDLDLVTRPTSTFYAFIPSQKYGTNSPVAYPTNFKYMSFVNFDNVGALDFFFLEGFSGRTVQANGVSGGTIYPMQSGSFVDLPHQRFLWADMDLDGDLDLFACDASGWKVFANTFKEAGIPQLVGIADLTISANAAATGDLNSDGKPDLVLFADTNGKMLVFLNTSTSSAIQFTLDKTLTGIQYSQLNLVDIDGQGGVDIVTNYTVLKNTLSTLSAPPPVPAGLECRYYEQRLWLNWQPVGNGNQYRYEVYRDGVLFISSESADDGSLLRYAKLPNIPGPPVNLSPLPEGQYTFRVQSVDASNRGSAFSPLKEMEEIPIPVGLDEVPVFSVYPNPTAERVSITVPSAGRVIIRDNVSRAIFQRDVDNDASRTMELLTGEWARGIFSIQFESGGKTSVQKLVVVR